MKNSIFFVQENMKKKTCASYNKQIDVDTLERYRTRTRRRRTKTTLLYIAYTTMYINNKNPEID